jgi:hypothetical protein
VKLKLERIVIRIFRSISFAQADDMDFFAASGWNCTDGLLTEEKKGCECMDGDGHPDTCKLEYAKLTARLCRYI